MISLQTQGKIFLADERGEKKSEQFRSLQLLNNKHFYNRHKQAVGNLRQLNDQWLAPGAVAVEEMGSAEALILLPIYGAVETQRKGSRPEIITAGQLQVINAEDITVINIRNPLTEAEVNYLSIHIAQPQQGTVQEAAVSTFDLQQFMNVLLEVWPPALHADSGNWYMSLGKFSGRAETTYQLRNRYNTFFAFVIAGAFEVEGRLLHARDGLALWNLEAAEAEALSNDALLLVLEISEPVSGI